MKKITVDEIKSKLADLADPAVGPDYSWNEGYISALADTNQITEKQFDQLLAWSNQSKQANH